VVALYSLPLGVFAEVTPSYHCIVYRARVERLLGAYSGSLG
jgi:hypothetical protein